MRAALIQCTVKGLSVRHLRRHLQPVLVVWGLVTLSLPLTACRKEGAKTRSHRVETCAVAS